LSDAASFAIEATDDASKVKQIWVVIDGKPQVYIKPIYFLKEGTHSLSYYSVDNVGNKEEPKTFHFNTVSTPPRTIVKTTGAVVNTGGINFATRTFQMDLEGQDNVVGVERVEVKIDNELDFKPYVESIRFSAIGMHNVTYRSVDRCGNVEPARTYTLALHEVPPETSYTTAQPLMNRDGITYSSAPNVLTFNVGNSPVGVKQTLVSINDGNFAPYSGPITLTADHKIYKIGYKSVDKLGNEEKVKFLNVNMISNVPIVDLFISNGKSNEEQVRTNYLDQGVAQPQKQERTPASQ